MNHNTTVFCAVWHKDPDREALLRKHYENLQAQTSVPDVVYIFDNNDCPPAWLQARYLICSTPLTIYEAWNLAITCCRTPFVMNLNLDDWLCTDTVEQFERALLEQEAMLVGGDWDICFSQAATDAVGRCRPASSVPFDPAWPPRPGQPVRLGSGTGQRRTFGPATMWRLDAHLHLPRYPYRAADGSLIKGVSDGVFWTLIEQHFQMRTARLPLIVGHYFSHPEAQAEFRYADEDAHVAALGVSLL